MPISSPSWRRAEPGAHASTGQWRWLGRVPFAATALTQETLRAEIRDDRAPETLLLLEHDPVITLGRSANAGNVLFSEAALAEKGVDVHHASRGGDVTYHGPGQLVGYPLIRLRAGVRAYIEALAAGLADVLSELGVVARYRPDAPGLWVGPPTDESKICAFGVHVRHRITMHGFALNLDPDLGAFNLIVPCGLPGARVTSVRLCRGSSPTPLQLSERVAAALGARLGIAFAPDNTVTNCNASAVP
jgi:lipoate-protein ligase B